MGWFIAAGTTALLILVMVVTYRRGKRMQPWADRHERTRFDHKQADLDSKYGTGGI